MAEAEVRPGRVAVVAPTQPMGRATTLQRMVDSFPPPIESLTYGEEHRARMKRIRAYKPPPPFPRMMNRPDKESSESEFEDAVEPEPENVKQRMWADKPMQRGWSLQEIILRVGRAVAPWSW